MLVHCDERDYEFCHKGGDGLDADANFLCDAGLDELAVRLRLLRYGSGGPSVVVGDFFTQGSVDVAGQVGWDVGEERNVD
jgi:hypothetical protein